MQNLGDAPPRDDLHNLGIRSRLGGILGVGWRSDAAHSVTVSNVDGSSRETMVDSSPGL